MTTELVEKVTVNGIDYDFIWPTGSKNEDGTYESATFNINGKTVCELTDFDSQIATSDKSGEEGTYLFEGIPAGNYVVRFTYGDDNTLDVTDEDWRNRDKWDKYTEAVNDMIAKTSTKKAEPKKETEKKMKLFGSVNRA